MPVMCGGWYFIGETAFFRSDCAALHSPEPIAEMTDMRYRSDSIILSTKRSSFEETPILWVTGGAYSHDFFLSTTDLITLSQTENGPNIPRALMGHCLVMAEHDNDNQIVLIGGESALG